MTTTAQFQSKPDFYNSIEECQAAIRDKEQTNDRYRNFKQDIFTAGDEEQFEHYRDARNYNVCISDISLASNIFAENDIFSSWEKYKNLEANAVINTFRYIFHKFKKGIFVKIVNNKLDVFLPFSKANFTNEWHNNIHIDTSKYSSLTDFIHHINIAEGRHYFNPNSINQNTDEWYANNCLVRYEEPINEGDTNIGNLKNMLEELCKNRKLPDIEFFINRRDFPILTRNSTEPYYNLWNTKNKPLVSHKYEKYCPIFSMSKTEYYSDILMPTYEDWARVQSFENKWFPKSCNKTYKETFNIPWSKKIPTAVFRGSTTGCGVTIDTNTRLKIAYLSSTQNIPNGEQPMLDAGITSWNFRPRKLEDSKYLQTIDKTKLPFDLLPPLTPKQQSNYKYIINIDGHVAAFRLSLELNMGSVILWARTEWNMWYTNFLIPYKHYVPIKTDLSDLFTQIKWCREHDKECIDITNEANTFYATYLQKKGIFDYMQKILVDLKKEMGVYLYNLYTPLQYIISNEKTILFEHNYPPTTKTTKDINTIPEIGRCYGLLGGVGWIVNKIINESSFENVAKEYSLIFKNKLGFIRDFRLANFAFIVKTTSDEQKINEHIHENFVGQKCINELSKHIPNFVYIFGCYIKNDTYNVVSERIYGETLFQYINSPNFSFQEYLFIIIQISLALQVAQNMCGLVHYDLTPWNIMIQRLKEPQMFDYVISYNKIIRIKTSVIPIIIDYGKSHVIYNGIHHGFINMFNMSTIQDIFTLLITSIDQIINKQKLPAVDFGNLFKLANFLTNTSFRKKPFENANELRTFLKKAKRYSEIINSPKYELENKTPYDLVNYIAEINQNKTYNLSFGFTKNYSTSIMDKGNSKQIFEYILSNTIEEKINTYKNVFIRLKQCTIPQPKNKLFVYYAAQQLENNLMSVRNNMLQFLQQHGILTQPYEKVIISTIKFLHQVYTEKIKTMPTHNISYEILGDFKNLTKASYDKETFLIPENIIKLLNQQKNASDLSEYKDLIISILLCKGTYILSDEDREYYMNNFRLLLDQSTIVMKNNCANDKTLTYLSKAIYSSDLENLRQLITSQSENNCSYVDKYIKQYIQIV